MPCATSIQIGTKALMDSMEDLEKKIVRVVLVALREDQGIAQLGVLPLPRETPPNIPPLPREIPSITPPILKEVESSSTFFSRGFAHGVVDVLNKFK